MSNWVGVASAEHVRKGRVSGFMQVCHGKESPLRRLKPNDGVIYYSPTVTFGGKDKLQWKACGDGPCLKLHGLFICYWGPSP